MKRVLIVEDEYPLANALKIKLESHDFEVHISNDGEEAVKEILNSANKYDVMLLDIMMPKLSGFDVLEKMKNDNINHPPTIVMTNLSQPEDKEKAKELGAMNFFVKSDTPINDIVNFIVENIM